METERILELFDEHVRRRGVDQDGLFVGDGWAAVLTVPPDVGRTLARLRELPGHAEWKLYGHDPAWLPERLRAAGMAPDDEETVVVAELDRARLRDIRAKLPSLANRRPDAYRWKSSSSAGS